MIGKTLGHYRISGRLGSGGMGEVYLATDTRLDRKVALKTLPVKVARDSERRARFEREAKAVAALNHPNIVTIHSVEEHEGVSFITMELVEGKSLAELIPPGGLSLSQVFDVAVPLADALAAAHKKGVTHRDLKPGNVMVTDEGRVKVLDFGLAKLTETAPADEGEESHLPTATAAVTGEGKILGTVAYMSPEQAEGKPVDTRSDVFSLGVVLYEMSTGHRPFHGDTPVSTITSILRDTPPPVGELKPTLPRHLGRVIQRCMAKQPDRRYQAALDVRNELEGLKGEIDSGEMQVPSATGVVHPSQTPPAGAPSTAVGSVVSANGVPPTSTDPSVTGAPPTSVPPDEHPTSVPPGIQPTSVPPTPGASLPPTRVPGASFPPGAVDSQVTSVPPAPRTRTWLIAGVAVAAVILIVAAVFLWPGLRSTRSGPAGITTDDKSIAVLPFANMSDDKENEYFSDGLSEELLNLLSKVPDLRVAARTSSFHFKGHTGDVSDVARQLNVATILEGSVRRAGNRVRVTAQLVNASDGFPLWSETYDRQLDDIFGIQEEIAIQVVDALKITLLGEDAQRLAARPTDSIEAYDAYLLGHQRMRRRRAESLEEATGYFQRAIDLDPGFTLAYVGLAQANIHLSNYGTLSKSEMVERVEPLLDKALELDDKLGEAHAVHGLFRQERFDIDDAVTEFERAIELNPNYALAYMWYGNVMNMRDPERGMTLLRQALELDPLSPLIHHNIASNLRTAGRYDEALRGFERVVEIDPGFSVSYQAIADLYEEDLGRPDEAIGWAERAVESDPGNLGLRVGLGNRLRNRGEFDDALKVYRETIDLDPGYVPAYRAIADLHAARGRLDEAARWNHEAYQREPSFQDTLISMANLYVRLSDEPSARLWHSRLKESEEVEFLSGFVQARIHARHGELARSEAILRELAARVPRFGRIWIFGWDLEAGNYDAILAREAQYEPTLFEDDPEVNFRNVWHARMVARALQGIGDLPRAELLLRECEEFLLGLDEAARRARYPDLLGYVYLDQGRHDDALAEWRAAFENGWRHDWWVLDAAELDPVRDDPRFQALLDDTEADFDRQRRALAREGLANAEPSF
jgi:serine/threonine protein kinase/tetratricopeptide (TPR) repeat protein